MQWQLKSGISSVSHKTRTHKNAIEYHYNNELFMQTSVRIFYDYESIIKSQVWKLLKKFFPLSSRCQIKIWTWFNRFVIIDKVIIELYWINQDHMRSWDFQLFGELTSSQFPDQFDSHNYSFIYFIYLWNFTVSKKNFVIILFNQNQSLMRYPSLFSLSLFWIFWIYFGWNM